MAIEHDRDTEQDEPIRVIIWWLAALCSLTYAAAFWGAS